MPVWLTTFHKKLEAYPPWVAEIGVYGLIAFIAGFLTKVLGRWLFFGTIGAALALAFLYYTHVITIDLQQLKQLIGMSSAQTFQDVLGQERAWLHEHPVACIAMLAGFLLGWVLG